VNTRIACAPDKKTALDAAVFHSRRGPRAVAAMRRGRERQKTARFGLARHALHSIQGRLRKSRQDIVSATEAIANFPIDNERGRA
jgi:hypothetical protein